MFGIKKNLGYVRTWIEKVAIACSDQNSEVSSLTLQIFDIDDNDCSQGSLIGGILGAGLGSALSWREGRMIRVPIGVAAGAMVGCQIDGG